MLLSVARAVVGVQRPDGASTDGAYYLLGLGVLDALLWVGGKVCAGQTESCGGVLGCLRSRLMRRSLDTSLACLCRTPRALRV